jgi:hypothetical protein
MHVPRVNHTHHCSTVTICKEHIRLCGPLKAATIGCLLTCFLRHGEWYVDIFRYQIDIGLCFAYPSGLYTAGGLRAGNDVNLCAPRCWKLLLQFLGGFHCLRSPPM